MRTITGLVVAALAVTGCQGNQPGELDDGTGAHGFGVQRAELRAIEGCEDLGATLRQRAVDQMTERVMQSYLAASTGVYCYAPSTPPGAGWWNCTDDGSGLVCEADSDGAVAGETDADKDEGASLYSTTNTQEEGVDEADFVKNDGSYLYLVSGAELVIIDVWPAEASEVVARVELEGTPTRLYVHDDHAVVYSDRVADDPLGESCTTDSFTGRWSCGSRDLRTTITVLDITDRADPRIEREVTITGAYVDSRRIGDAVHTVTSYAALAFSDLPAWPADLESCDADEATIWRSFAELIRSNTEVIEARPLEEWVPTVTDTVYAQHGRSDQYAASTTTDLLGGCDGYFEAVGSAAQSFLSVASFDLLEPEGDIAVSSVVGDPGVVYASRDALYVASRQSRGDDDAWYFDDASTEATTVHRFAFDLDAPATTYEASGAVPGRLLNQFSMGEHQGFLRVATTIGHLPSPDCSNNVYVLEPRAGALEVVGEVTGIAPSEDIRSVRFVGDRGFVVTFKKTDPLFVLDLADPERPRIAGELEIPGFSTYMHMMDADHLLTIGFDAEDMGDFAWFAGVQLQIFDVSDMANPLRTHLEVIGTRGTASEATGNHLAFNYFPPLDLLAIPMAICEGGSGGSYGDVMTFNGLLVYDVTVEGGFAEHGRISHGEAADGYGCNSWWTDSSSQVKRSVIMDDFVFSIASDRIVVAGLDDLSSPLGSIELPLHALAAPDGE